MTLNKRFILLLLALLLGFSCGVDIIDTIAGSSTQGYSGDNGPATSAAFNFPSIIDLDSVGNVFVVDTNNNRIRKITASTGIITTIAGSGNTGSTSGSYSGDNTQATSATLSFPSGLSLDFAGNVYIGDRYNHRIRKVTVSTGIITTIAGTGTASYSGDNGPATAAALNEPTGVVVDTSGNVYIADGYSNHRVRKVTVTTGIITTIAGTGTPSYSGDGGPATSATLNYPTGLKVDAAGNIYINDLYNHRVRKMTVSTGSITTIAGSGSTGSTSGSYSGDNGQATAATLNYQVGLSLDTTGNFYIADTGNHRIRKVTVSTGIITTFAGNGSTSYSGDNGPATSANLNSPHGAVVDAVGNLFIADSLNNRIRKVTVSTSAPSMSPTLVPSTSTPSTATPSSSYPSLSPSIGTISTIAGSGSQDYSGDNGPATSAGLNHPYGVTLDASGNVYIADQSNNRVRKLTASTGIITTIAGGTGTGSSGDNGAATSAGLVYPIGIALDTAGNFYIAEYKGSRVRKVTVSTGIITTFAGTGTSSYSGDNGPATSAALYGPITVALDASGNVYIADLDNHRIRKVTVSTGIITTIAGTGSTIYSGDGGAATSATLYHPTGLAFDAAGNVFIGDSHNHRIRKVAASTGIITTIAGTGTSSYSGDGGAATAAELYSPRNLVFDSLGDLYIADQGNNRVRKVTISTGIITTIAGTGSSSYNGDSGQATSVGLCDPSGVALDSSGNLYIGDTYNNRVRKVIMLTATSSPSFAPTAAPTAPPSSVTPTSTPSTMQPTYLPTSTPSTIPTSTPSTASPSFAPTRSPSSAPSYLPSNTPSVIPTTMQPTSSVPSFAPTRSPTSAPTFTPTSTPTVAPSFMPSFAPTRSPTSAPTFTPTFTPTVTPSFTPSIIPTFTPTYIPTSTPSKIPSSAPSHSPSSYPSFTPSFTPTLSPSAYPTYSSSVRVYFTVTQELAGISATTYSNSKVSNDALFKQTVASMLGYDSRKEDVTIHLVTDTVQSRMLSVSTAAAVQVCEVMYSIATPTFIFNDTNHATAMFIQALNESIAIGAFDLLLHSNAGSSISWQSITTDYVIFSTASPTSSPTSTPTTAPTKRDNVAVNLLAVPLDDQVTKAKVKYYLGTFMGYFLAIYICLYLYSYLRYGKLTATQLYDSSYQSELHVRNSAVTSGGVEILCDLLLKNGLVQSNMKLQDELMMVKQSAKVKYVNATGEESKYSKGYREYMHQQRVLLGCSPFLYPAGYAVKIPCVSREIVFPPGRVEDMLLYICHNHPLFSCFYFMDGSKLGAHGTRILYIGKDVAVFVLYQFSNMLLQYYMLDGHGLDTLINLFIITPSAVSVGLLLKYLYTCPFTETVDFQRRYAKYHLTVLFLGRLAILPIMVIMFGSLIIACLLSSNRDVPLILVNYFVFVQFYGILFAIAKAVLLFRDNYYYQLTLFGVLDILCVGQLYKERILAEQLVVDVDYAYRINTYLFGLINVQKILSRDDAIKAKWITVRGEGGSIYDIEMKGNDDPFISVQMNQLMEELANRNSAVFSMDGIFSANNNSKEEDVDGYNVYSINTSKETQVVTAENPIHSLASALTAQRLQETAIVEAVDDDAALYLEYQNLQDSHDNTLYDMSDNDDNEVAMTFEEWKATRKQFKQGTRGSFVKAFQVFEEREKVALDSLEASASVRNTLKLHSTKVKNILAATRTLDGAANNKPK